MASPALLILGLGALAYLFKSKPKQETPPVLTGTGTVNLPGGTTATGTINIPPPRGGGRRPPVNTPPIIPTNTGPFPPITTVPVNPPVIAPPFPPVQPPPGTPPIVLPPVPNSGGMVPPFPGGTATTPPPATQGINPLQAQIAAAIASRAPVEILRLADVLQAQGLNDAANNLRAIAAQIKAGQAIDQAALDAASKILGSTITPTVPGTTSTGTTTLPPVSGNEVLAQTLVTALNRSKKGGEDKLLVKRYQEQEGIKPDGLYGAETALTLLKYNLIPPKPFYWPANFAQAKKSYSSQLLMMAAKEPSRGALWKQAAQV